MVVPLRQGAMTAGHCGCISLGTADVVVHLNVPGCDFDGEKISGKGWTTHVAHCRGKGTFCVISGGLAPFAPDFHEATIYLQKKNKKNILMYLWEDRCWGIWPCYNKCYDMQNKCCKRHFLHRTPHWLKSYFKNEKGKKKEIKKLRTLPHLGTDTGAIWRGYSRGNFSLDQPAALKHVEPASNKLLLDITSNCHWMELTRERRTLALRKGSLLDNIEYWWLN